MDYILQLRQYVGQRPILLVGAAVLVLDKQNRLLMMKRSDIGCWVCRADQWNPQNWWKLLPGVKRLRKPISKLERCHSSVYSLDRSFTTNTRMGMKFIMSALFIRRKIGGVK
jgi:hypothetical protein